MRNKLPRFAAWALALAIVAPARSAIAIQISVINDTNEIAYFRFGGSTAPQGSFTYLSGPMQTPVTVPLAPNPNVQFKIEPNSKLTGIDLTYIDAGKLLFSLDTPFTGGYPSGGGAFNPNFQLNSGPNALIRWDKMELTVHGDGFDSGNLSSTDFFGLRLSAETLKGGQPTGNSLTWRTPDTGSVFSAIAAHTVTTADAIVTGPNGLTVPGLGNVLRAIAPSTAAPTAYASLQPYLDFVQSNAIQTHVKGQFFGSPASTYDFVATICDGSNGCAVGSAKLVGTISTDPSKTHTVIIPPVDQNGRSLAYQLYLQDFKYTVDGGPVQNVGANDAFTAAARDFLAGFAFGLVGSSAVDPRTNKAFKDESTDYWYSANYLNLPTHLTVDDVFSHAAPQPNFYNTYAAEISGVSDSYGFPFTDVLGKPLLALGPDKADQLVVTIMPDGVTPPPNPFLLLFALPETQTSFASAEVPEPSGAALLLSGLVLARWSRARRA